MPSDMDYINQFIVPDLSGIYVHPLDTHMIYQTDEPPVITSWRMLIKPENQEYIWQLSTVARYDGIAPMWMTALELLSNENGYRGQYDALFHGHTRSTGLRERSELTHTALWLTTRIWIQLMDALVDSIPDEITTYNVQNENLLLRILAWKADKNAVIEQVTSRIVDVVSADEYNLDSRLRRLLGVNQGILSFPYASLTCFFMDHRIDLEEYDLIMSTRTGTQVACQMHATMYREELFFIDVCYQCGGATYTLEDDERPTDYSEEVINLTYAVDFFCESCFDNYTTRCIGCNCYYIGEACPDCHVIVNNYSYTPEPIFHPELPASNRMLYIGMELEFEWGGYEGTEHLARIFKDEMKGRDSFYYLKHDSSVEYGAEAVTHPFEPLWGLRNVLWHRWDTAIEEDIVRPECEDAGQHIHLSKDAFDSAHMWKFLQIHHRMPDFCAMVGGRSKHNHWGAFGPNWERARIDVKNFAKDKVSSIATERYIAVNLQPEHTIELRYPAGDVTTSNIKKNIQWAQVLYEFSSELTVTQVKNGILDTPGALLWYIQNNTDYTTLQEYITGRVPIPTPLANYS